MDSSIVTALAALLGSLIGGLTSLATSWVTQKHSGKSQWLREEVAKREILYSAFIDEASQRRAGAAEHNISSPAQIVHFYALFNRIRFLGSDKVARTAENVMEITISLYNAPNVTLQELSASNIKPDEPDPLLGFSSACRRELADLKGGVG